MPQVPIERSARRLRAGVLLAFAVIVVLYLAARFDVHIAGLPVHWQSRTGSQAGEALFGDAAMLLLTVSVYWLTEALRAVGSGGVFSRTAVSRFRNFAVWLLVLAIFNYAAATIAARDRLSDGRMHRVMVLVDVRGLLLIGITLVLLLITRMFERARIIEDEMKEIV